MMLIFGRDIVRMRNGLVCIILGDIMLMVVEMKMQLERLNKQQGNSQKGKNKSVPNIH